MKVGLGVTAWSRGIQAGRMDGIAHYSQELFRHLKEPSVVPTVFGGKGCSDVDGVAVKRLPLYSASALGSAVFGAPFPCTRSLQNSMDLFHATDHFTPRLSSIPVVTTLHDAFPLSNPEWASQRLRTIKNLLWKRSGHWADHVITVSEYSKTEISRHFGIAYNKITVIPSGVNARYFERIAPNEVFRVSMGLDLPERFFLFIGTFQPRKNLGRIIDAHEALPFTLRKSVPLVIAGQNGWGSDALVSRLKSYGDLGTVRWLRRVDDLTKRVLLQKTVALVFPSLAEGFGLPVLEAFASQAPVITSNTTSLPEVAGQAAWLVDPLNVDAIAEAMTVMARDETIRRDFIDKGLGRARAFTWAQCASGTEAVYSRVLRGR